MGFSESLGTITVSLVGFNLLHGRQHFFHLCSHSLASLMHDFTCSNNSKFCKCSEDRVLYKAYARMTYQVSLQQDTGSVSQELMSRRRRGVVATMEVYVAGIA